ncbi:TetR/AcrR family transcriptional regulator [Pseudofrankia asymbiotica]|uniref:HTH tetR-type domain-containing protein n=1 Tax=Pseudofrankia asymbiotica TaxID=1834516 RepID=A0A1V2I7U1_9ACTN|nr:TetR/AcrR family transcriptional regulator [Pseudofrankia asymbiotica]ONH28019.1 hypothetical protein BL253_20660 [Pseudofrankia asymbiotica]
MPAQPQMPAESSRRAGDGARPARRRDAAATREALLAAAKTLFAERGYEGTRLRDVAAEAGVDVALVARYFGGKHGLHRAALASEVVDAVSPAGDESATELVARIFEMWDDSGIGSGVPAFVIPGLAPEVRAPALRLTEQRLIGPLAAKLSAQGVGTPVLRAQAMVAALIGIGLVRAVGSMPELARADRDDLVRLLGPAAELITEGQVRRRPGASPSAPEPLSRSPEPRDR